MAQQEGLRRIRELRASELDGVSCQRLDIALLARPLGRSHSRCANCSPVSRPTRPRAAKWGRRRY
eukprot:864468-Pyramimonas_sp.AAC.1